MDNKRIKSIDGLRGLGAILIAFFCHFRLNNVEWMSVFSDICNYVVELFFEISGFGIAYTYRDRIINISGIEFLSKRYKKILPLYWITLFIATILYIYFEQLEITYSSITPNFLYDPFIIILSITGTVCGWAIGVNPTNGPAWYINVLFLCYIIYFIIAKQRRKGNDTYILFLLIWFFIGFVGIFNSLQIPFFYEASCRGYISFSMGALLYELYEKLDKQAGEVYTVIGSVVLVIVLLFCDYGILSRETRLIVVMLVCPIVLFSAIYNRFIKKILESKVCSFLTKISMGIYMWHWSVLLLLTSIGDRVSIIRYGTFGGYVVYIFLTFLISIISTYYIEPKLISSFEKLLDKSFKKERL